MSTDNDAKDRAQDRKRCIHHYYQLGAPTLIYEGNRTNNSHSLISPLDMYNDTANDIYEAYKRSLAVKARWHYSIDANKSDSISVPNLTYGKRNTRNMKRKRQMSTNQEEDAENREHCSKNSIAVDGEEDRIHNKIWIDEKQQRDRLAMLLKNDNRSSRHRECLRNYSLYDHPYVATKVDSKDSNKRTQSTKHRLTSTEVEPKLESVAYSKSQEFSINYHINSDPSYLAPFHLDSIKEATNYNDVKFQKKMQYDPPERLSHGNSLLSVLCPCRSCSKKSSKESYVILHPKGYCLERLCVSNLIPPIYDGNDGGMKNVDMKKKRNANQFRWDIMDAHPNEISLDDTILEIRQCGVWDVDNLQCLFAVRTGTHISIVNITCRRPQSIEQKQDSLENTTCWGCYVIKEIERIDNRSFSPKFPSFRPVSLTSHPRYGNIFSPSKFCFVSHSAGSIVSTYNVVHSCLGTKDNIMTERHDINNLKIISLIDFSNYNPMCLWSVGSSFVRPALTPGVISTMQGQEKGPFGLGSSLFTIDLRSNSATFQWSPSADGMVTEGVHSINGILTDWTRDSTVWVTSSSAGKTWEIDGRMPCKAVNTWSLTAICESSKNITLPRKAFFGENTLLTKPISHHGDIYELSSSVDYKPIIKVDTDYSTNGIHLLQKPLNRPRFQTDSLECIAEPGIPCTERASIATSSFFNLPDVPNGVYICGLSSVRLPIRSFVEANENIWPQYTKHELDVICTLTMTNDGDIYSHSLLECNGEVEHDCHRFEGLPIGTTAITIPKELDGRTKILAEGHSKPTAGMNLNIFLSNLYPLACDAKLSRANDDNKRNEILVSKSKTSKVDDSMEVIEIKTTNETSGLMVREENKEDNRHVEMVNNGLNLMMPTPRFYGKGRTVVHAENDNGDGDIEDSLVRTAIENKSLERNKLSESTIKNVLDYWDSKSESESEEIGLM